MSQCQFNRRLPQMVVNLVSLHNRATEADIINGEVWYPNARRIVSEWSDTYNVSETTVACVIAALSPQIDWPRNLIMADDVLAQRPLSIQGLRKNEEKARLIARVEPIDIVTIGIPAEVMRYYFPTGPKVGSFAENLAGRDDIVTVDTHAMQAALNDVEARYTLKWTPYQVFQSAYTRAAQRVNRSPAEFQAIIWHVWKRLNPPQHKRNVRRQWEVIGELEG